MTTPQQTIDHLRKVLFGCQSSYDEKWDEQQLLHAYCFADEITSSLFWLFKMNGFHPPWQSSRMLASNSDIVRRGVFDDEMGCRVGDVLAKYWSSAETAKRLRHCASKLEAA